MRRLLVPLSLLALAFAMFALWINLGVLDPRRVGWLLDGNDRGQNSLGLIAYLRMAPRWPSLHDPLLMAPEGLGVALTDSNPLLALLLRPFAGWLLPPGWQYAGWWLLACFMLQVSFAWALVRPHARDFLTALAATALLGATPVLFARYGHINLCAQWLILWALWLFVDLSRARPLAWAALLGIAGLIHPYLLVMVAAIWASALLREFVTEPRARWRTLAGVLPGAAVLAGIAVFLGYLAEPFGSTQSYGAFGMALDALWNPGNEGYSRLLPAAASSSAQGFEGMNYLGAGLLLLVAIIVVDRIAGRRGTSNEAMAPSFRTLLWLLPAFTILTLVAIGPEIVWRGHLLVTLPLSAEWIDLLDPVRASGRMFWPAYYTIIYAIVASVCRIPAARTAMLVALALQLLDFQPALATLRGWSARAGSTRVYYRTRDAHWASMVRDAAAIEMHPYEAYRDLPVLEEVAWRAITACRPVPLRYFYASREPRSVQRRMAEDNVLLERGFLDSSRLYVFLREPPPPAVAAKAIRVDGIWIIPPAVAVPPQAHCR